MDKKIEAKARVEIFRNDTYSIISWEHNKGDIVLECGWKYGRKLANQPT